MPARRKKKQQLGINRGLGAASYFEERVVALSGAVGLLLACQLMKGGPNVGNQSRKERAQLGGKKRELISLLDG